MVVMERKVFQGICAKFLQQRGPVPSLLVQFMKQGSGAAKDPGILAHNLLQD
jgi:hypothetical protein